jgi:superfamily II DNA or RNA helicase
MKKLRKRVKKYHNKFQFQSSFVLESLKENNLYEHQRDALLKIKNYFSSTREKYGLVVLPTGSGKSGIIALTPYILEVRKVLILTPSIHITRQIYSDMCANKDKTFYERIGIIDSDETIDFCEDGVKVEKSSQLEMIKTKFLVICNAHKFGETSNVNIEDISKDSFDLIIVDEGHHYPAETWKKIVEHFDGQVLFMTATPFNNGKPILDQKNWVFSKSYEYLEKKGIIRSLSFEEVVKEETDKPTVFLDTIITMIKILNLPERKGHQAMLLTHKIWEADLCVSIINKLKEEEYALTFHSNSDPNNLRIFKENKIRILVVCGKLLEGFDRKEVSIVCILRNIAPSSRVLFSQFVGRSVRKLSGDDKTPAIILSHSYFQQKENFNIMKSYDSVMVNEKYNSISLVHQEDDKNKENKKPSNRENLKKIYSFLKDSKNIEKFKELKVLKEIEMDQGINNKTFFDTGIIDSEGEPIIHYKLQDDAPDYDTMLERIGFVAKLTIEEERYFENLI